MSTDLARDYEAGLFDTLSLDEYVDIICELIPIIPKNIVIHRLTGDGPKNLLISPQWSAEKKEVLNALNRQIMERKVFQNGLSDSVYFSCEQGV